MKVLIVGAGAVGQVYGYYLQAGGAEVTFYVRPKYVEELKKGMTLYPRNDHRDLRHPEHMTGFGLISSESEVQAVQWDYAILCTHGGAVLTPWFGPFAQALGNATLVNLSPDLEGRAAISKFFPESRVINGMITLISYIAPLPGEVAVEPGTAFWFPPMTKVPFQGPESVVKPLLAAFRKGGFPCEHLKAQGDTPGGITADIVLSTFVLALEGVGWKFKAFLEPAQSARTKAAILESLQVQYLLRGWPRPKLRLLRLILGRTFFRIVLFGARLLMPFDLEVYLKIHFTKIRDQRSAGLAATFKHAQELGVEVPALRALGGPHLLAVGSVIA